MQASFLIRFLIRFDKKDICPFIKDKVELYLRYIDDIIFIWKGTDEELRNFFNQIKKKLPLSQFGQKYLKSEIELLNVLFYKDEKQRLPITIFKKKTKRQSYLHAKSDHLTSLKK